MDETIDRARLCRRLMRAQAYAVLATSLADGASARPYASLVAVACDMDAGPLLLISDLAQHSRNIAADRRVSLLFDAGTPPAETDPLAKPRVTLLGEAARCDDRRSLARFVARHPGAAQYAGFADFHLYRVAIGRGHLVAGFGRIAWVEADDLRFAGDTRRLAEAEPDIVAHMNTDHADAVALYAARLLRRPEGAWRMTGIDPEGIDLRSDDEIARLDFADHGFVPVFDPASARQALVALVAAARAMPAG
ncbi:MAG: DUF2470 domain-containing protein [Stellaceae bacterium]